MPRLEAEALESQAVAAATPHLKARDRGRFFDRLADIIRPRPRRPAVQVKEHDPAKAAEYFRSLGVDVVTTDG